MIRARPRPQPFVLMYGGHRPTEEYRVTVTAPLYHLAFACPVCAEVWARQRWLIPPHSSRWWFVPTPCPEHGGKGFIEAPINTYHRSALWATFKGADLRREFMYATQGDLK